MKDRQPTKILENGAIRYGVYGEDGLQRYEYMKLEDEPSEEGTPLNKATLLSDETTEKVWPNPDTRPEDPTVNQALGKLAEPNAKIGDITITTRSDFSDAWLRCDGRSISQAAYPELYDALRTAKRDANWSLTAVLDNYVITDGIFINGQWILLDAAGYLFSTENPEDGVFIAHTDLHTKASALWTFSSQAGCFKIVYADGYFVVIDQFMLVLYFANDIDGPWTMQNINTSDFSYLNNTRIYDIAYNDVDGKWYLSAFYSYQGTKSYGVYVLETPEVENAPYETYFEIEYTYSTINQPIDKHIFCYKGLVYTADYIQNSAHVRVYKNKELLSRSNDALETTEKWENRFRGFAVISGQVIAYDSCYYVIFDGDTGTLLKEKTPFPSELNGNIMSIRSASGGVLIITTTGIYRASSMEAIADYAKESDIQTSLCSNTSGNQSANSNNYRDTSVGGSYAVGGSIVNSNLYLVFFKNDNTSVNSSDVLYEDYDQLEKFIPGIQGIEGVTAYIKAKEE